MGTQPPPRKGQSSPPTFRSMCIVAKRSPISATAELLLHSSRQRVAILYYNGPSFPPLKLRVLMGDLDPHLIHGSLGPPESLVQTACRLVQQFLQCTVTDIPTDRPTDHATRSVAISHIYARSTVMRPKIRIMMQKKLITTLQCNM